MKFDFSSIVEANEDTSLPKEIKCDQMPYDSFIKPRCRDLFFKNDNGSVSIHGFLYIQGVDITKAVKIDKLSVMFSKELVDAQKISFNPPEVEITFMLNNDDIYEMVHNNMHRIPNQLEPCYEGQNELKIKGNSFNNINLMTYINEENRNINYDRELEEKLFQKKRISNTENVNNEIEMLASTEPIGQQDTVMKSASKKEEREYELNKDFISFDTEYEEEHKIKQRLLSNKKLVNSYEISQENTNAKKNQFTHSLRNDIFADGSYLTTDYNNKNRNDFKYNMHMKKMINNLDLIDNQCDMGFYEQYKEETIIDFFHIYLSSLIDNKEQMNVDDDKNENINQKTRIIMKYIGNLEIELEKAINSQIDKNTNDETIKKGTSSIKYRITEELFTLKLFKILFLNCFIDNTELNSNLYDSNSSPKVNKYRKKKLIEWLIEYNDEDFTNQINQIPSNNYQQQIAVCLTHGKIQRAVDIAVSIHNPMLALMISQLNSVERTSSLGRTLNNYYGRLQFSTQLNQIYSLLGMTQPIQPSTWSSYLLQILLFIANPSDVLSNCIKGINIQSYDINISLIELYCAIEENDIKKQKEIFNRMSTNTICFNHDNNYNDGSINADHHIQWIVSILLNDIVNDNYANNKVDTTTLNKLMFSLTKKNIEEILIGENSANRYYDILTKFISILPLPIQLKNSINEDILSHVEFKDIIPIDSNDENDILLNRALGYYHKANFNYDKAIECFASGHEYALASELLVLQSMKTLVYYRNEFNPKHTVEMMKKYDKQDFGGIVGLFYTYAIVMCDDYQMNVPFVCDLIKKIMSIKYADTLITAARSVMIDDLRRKLSEGFNEINKKNENEIYLSKAYSDIMKDKDIIFTTKVNEINRAISSLIVNQNKLYSSKEM